MENFDILVYSYFLTRPDSYLEDSLARVVFLLLIQLFNCQELETERRSCFSLATMNAPK